MEPKYASPVASPRASASFASPSVVGNFLDFMLPKAQSTAIKAVAQKSSSSPLRAAATYTVITNQSLSVRSSDPSAQRLSSPAVSSGGIDESMQLLNLEDLSACLLEYSTSSGAVGDQQTQQKLPKSTPSEVADGGVGGGDSKGISLEEQEAVEHAVRFNAEELRHLEEAFEDFSQQDTTAAAAAGCRPPSSRNVQSADTCGLLRSPPSMTTSVLESPDATMASSIPSLTESSSSKPSVADVETRCSVLSERNADVTNSHASPRSYKPTFPTAATLLSQEEEKEEEEEDIENQPPNTNSSKPVALLDAQDDSFSRSLSDPIYRRRLSTILECQSKESLVGTPSVSDKFLNLTAAGGYLYPVLLCLCLRRF
ncbi:unnamed protein product [Dibothriocephalus latus]|uniref:Uncharacterized protein n=1 Tax=Dibothriocephalus latus TaxID=60516 RepID=A0A3P7P8I8_DIBLA|nr:unnamed protein product [Dibothriocephalus latus]